LISRGRLALFLAKEFTGKQTFFDFFDLETTSSVAIKK
jgi:hypothetical protein